MSQPPTAAVPLVEDVAESTAPPTMDPSADIGARPPTAEHYATQENLVDPYFYEHYVLTKTTTWSTQQPVGAIVAIFEADPRSMHSGISYISKLYNCWSGGFEIGMEIAGTGFHGGKLGICKIPPNLDPRKMTAVNYSFYPYKLADPKLHGIVSFPLFDQRPVEYHYMNPLQDSKYGEWQSSGGYMVIFVWQQLVLASSGTSEIAVNFSTRLAPDFRFYQMMDPTLTQSIGSVIDYPLPQGSMFHPWLPVVLTKINTGKNVKLVGTGCGSAVALKDSSEAGERGQRPQVVTVKSTASTASTTWTFTVSDMLKNWNIQDRYALTGNQVNVYAFKSSSPIAYIHNENIAAIEMTGSANGYLTATSQQSVGFTGEVTHAALSFSGTLNPNNVLHAASTITSPRTFVTRLSEHFLLFGCDRDTVYGQCLPAPFMWHILSGAFNSLSKTESVVYLITTLEGVPLLYTRLNPEGFFSVHSGITTTQLSLDNVRFVYFSVISIYESLPLPTTQMSQFLHVYAKLDRMQETMVGLHRQLADYRFVDLDEE